MAKIEGYEMPDELYYHDAHAWVKVEDDGTVLIASTDESASQRAIDMVKAIVEDPEIGRIYRGTVKKVLDFGAFVEVVAGTDGLVHISQLADHRVAKVEDVVKEGDVVNVKVLDIDRDGKIRLSIKEAEKELGTGGKSDPE